MTRVHVSTDKKFEFQIKKKKNKRKVNEEKICRQSAYAIGIVTYWANGIADIRISGPTFRISLGI